MKRIKLLGLLLVSSLALTGCNKQLVDLNYRYTKVHIYETNTCYDISSWTDYEDGEQLQVHIKGKGKILISSTSCFLVEDKCPICD
jgi:hypothetical protein